MQGTLHATVSAAAATAAPMLYYNAQVGRLALLAHDTCHGARGVGNIEPTVLQWLLLQTSYITGVNGVGGSRNSNIMAMTANMGDSTSTPSILREPTANEQWFFSMSASENG